MTMATLADEYGQLDAQIKALKAQQEKVRKKLLAYASDVFAGDRFTVKRVQVLGERADMPAIKAYLGEDYQNFVTPYCHARLTVSATAPALDAKGKATDNL